MDFFLTGSTLGPSNVDSARQNLASSFVNGFVNAGFGQDKILKEDGNKWLHKNKDHGMYFSLRSVVPQISITIDCVKEDNAIRTVVIACCWYFRYVKCYCLSGFGAPVGCGQWTDTDR